MEFKTISNIENPLFNRREIEGEIHTEVTPSRQDVIKLLSKEFSVASENIKIRTIIGKFGSRVFVINANIYSSKEDKDKIEIKKKKDVEAEKKAGESVVEEKPTEETAQPEETIEDKQEEPQEDKKQTSE